jgi:hypothetical protein
MAFGVALLGLAFLSLLYVRQTGDVAATGYDVASLQRNQSDWERRNDQLRADIAQLESLDRIGTAASQRLGMGPPRHQLFVRATPVVPPPAPTPVVDAPAQPPSPILGEVRRVLGLP